jgi:hypothetical protein
VFLVLGEFYAALCFFFVLLFVCTSADGTASPAAITKFNEDVLKKKVTGNYKFAV